MPHEDQPAQHEDQPAQHEDQPAQHEDQPVSNDDQTVFTASWQAEAHAMATALIDARRFTAVEWSEALGRAIAEAQAAGDPDLGDTYYEHWFAALEALCVSKGLLPGTAIDAREEEWRQAYLHTPHGHPVELPHPDRMPTA